MNPLTYTHMKPRIKLSDNDDKGLKLTIDYFLYEI